MAATLVKTRVIHLIGQGVTRTLHSETAPPVLMVFDAEMRRRQAWLLTGEYLEGAYYHRVDFDEVELAP